MPLQLMVLQWKICETVFKVGLTTVLFYTVEKSLCKNNTSRLTHTAAY